MLTEPLSTAERAALRAEHIPCRVHFDHSPGYFPCMGDHEHLTRWPCPTVQLLDALEAAEAVLRDLVSRFENDAFESDDDDTWQEDMTRIYNAARAALAPVSAEGAV